MEPIDAFQTMAFGAFLLAIVPASIAESRRRKVQPGTLPFTWGLFQGFGALFFGMLGLYAGLRSGGDALAAGIIIAMSYGPVGFFVIRRKRWAWVAVTILSFNPILWIAHYVYGRNRWAEFGAAFPSRSSARARQNFHGTGRISRVVSSWHPGKLILLWVGAMVILFLSANAAGSEYEVAAFVFWLIACTPLYYLTWQWFGARER